MSFFFKLWNAVTWHERREDETQMRDVVWCWLVSNYSFYSEGFLTRGSKSSDPQASSLCRRPFDQNHHGDMDLAISASNFLEPYDCKLRGELTAMLLSLTTVKIIITMEGRSRSAIFHAAPACQLPQLLTKIENVLVRTKNCFGYTSTETIIIHCLTDGALQGEQQSSFGTPYSSDLVVASYWAGGGRSEFTFHKYRAGGFRYRWTLI